MKKKKFKPKTPKYTDGGKTKSNKLQLSNKDVDDIARYLHSQKDNEEGSPEYWKTQNYIQSLSEGDRGRINSYYNSPQFKKLMDKESGPNINFLMPDKQGKYVDSGVNPFDALLSLPSNVSKGTKVLTDWNKKKITPVKSLEDIAKDIDNMKIYPKSTANNQEMQEMLDYLKKINIDITKHPAYKQSKSVAPLKNQTKQISSDAFVSNIDEQVLKRNNFNVGKEEQYFSKVNDELEKHIDVRTGMFKSGKLQEATFKARDDGYNTDAFLKYTINRMKDKIGSVASGGKENYERFNINPNNLEDIKKATKLSDIQKNKYGGIIKYKNGGALDELKNVGLFAADTMLAEWAPNTIKQDQYADTKFGKQLGNVAAVNESLSSQSPISKNVSKNWNDNKTGYNQTQMNYYKQAQPIAKTGSKIGEMWAGSAMGGVGGNGMTGQMIQGGAQQGLNAQYDPTQTMQWNDPNNPEGQYPYGGVYNLMHPFAKPGPMYMNKFPMGGNVVNPNAQLELDENTLNPDGSTTQFNLPPHEQQHPNAGTQLQPDTMIFSAKLRPKGEKKSYAQLNKINNTDKEEKIINNKLSNALSINTAKKMKEVKNLNSINLFKQMEADKANKINKYIKRLGGKFTYTDGGFVNNEPDPILTAKVKLNNDPSKIGPNINYGAYNAFQSYLNSKGLVNDPRMNTNEGRKALTDESINDFNTNSPYIKKFPKNTVTANDIIAIQKYHKLTDPNVVVDGWVGSQTSQMRYPTPFVDLGETDPKTGMPLDTTHAYPVKWGNKQYTLPGNKWKGYTHKDFTQVEPSGRPVQNRLGGLFKYRNAGYGPKTKLENDQYNTNSPMQFIGNPNDELQLLHPSNFGYINFQDWGQVGRAEQQMDSDIAASKKGNNTYTRDEIMKKDPYRYTNDGGDTNNSKANWGNMAYQAGSWLANNLGELAYLKDNGKKYDKQDFYEYTPELMDPSASLRDADNMARIARYDLADKSVGNSGNYMANRSGLAVNTMLAKDKIRREYGNINAGIKNQGKQYNIQNKYMTDDINARNKGAAYNQYYKSLERMGSNTAQSMKDNRAYKTEKSMLPFMKQAFSDPAFIEMFSKYMASQGKK